MPRTNRRSKYWCFTLNNPTEAEQDWFRRILRDARTRDRQKITYIVWQEEQPTDGTTHLQGYVEFSTQKTFSGAKRVISDRAHLENRNGTGQQAADYCKKTESRINGGFHGEVGQIYVPPEKDSLKTAAKLVKQGKSLMDLCEDTPATYIRYKTALTVAINDIKGHRDWAMTVDIFIGPSGTGKSCLARLLKPNSYKAPWPTGGRWWWPGYTGCGENGEGHDTVRLDEFRHNIKMGKMLELLDRGEMHLENKGGNLIFNSHFLIITTNIDPVDWYPQVSLTAKEPLERRIMEFCRIWDFGPMVPVHQRVGDFSEAWVNRTLRKDLNQPFNFRAQANLSAVADTRLIQQVQRNTGSVNPDWDNYDFTLPNEGIDV